MPWYGVFVLVIGAVVVGFALFNGVRRRRRSAVFRAVARESAADGSSSVEDDVAEATASVPELATVSHCVSLWREDLHIRIFENTEVQVQPGDPTATQTNILIALPGAGLADFTIEPVSAAVDMRMKVEKRHGVTVSGDRGFSDFNLVTATEPEPARLLLKKADVAPLLRGNRTLTIESRGDFLLLFESERLLGRKRIEELVDLGVAFARRLQTAL